MYRDQFGEFVCRCWGFDIHLQDPVSAGVVSLASSVTSLVLRASGARTAP